MTALPPYAATPEGLALCEQIIAEQPDWFLRRYDGSRYSGERVYKGKLAGQLRQMHKRWLDAEVEARDARWAAGDKTSYEDSPFHIEDGNALIYRLLDLHSRFWDRVEKSEDCWLWIGGRQVRRPFEKTGYGRFHLGGLHYVRASRMAVFLTTFEWPPSDQFVCHKCDNPACVRPDHLFLGTAAANAQDMTAKGRVYLTSCPLEKHARGTNHGSAKLTPEDVLAIRRAEGNQTQIGQRYGITQGTVSAIKHRKIWAHIPDEAEQLTECVGDPLRRVA